MRPRGIEPLAFGFVVHSGAQKNRQVVEYPSTGPTSANASQPRLGHVLVTSNPPAVVRIVSSPNSRSCRGGGSRRTCERPTSGSSRTGSSGFGGSDTCPRPIRGRELGIGRARPRYIWASRRRPSFAGPTRASCAAPSVRVRDPAPLCGDRVGPRAPPHVRSDPLRSERTAGILSGLRRPQSREYVRSVIGPGTLPSASLVDPGAA